MQVKGNGTEKMPAGANGTKLGQTCAEMEGGTQLQFPTLCNNSIVSEHQ